MLHDERSDQGTRREPVGCPQAPNVRGMRFHTDGGVGSIIAPAIDLGLALARRLDLQADLADFHLTLWRKSLLRYQPKKGSALGSAAAFS